jgi:hypothetical protein
MHPDRPCFKAEQFDIIVCRRALSQTTDPTALLGALLPSLRPGGHLLVAIPSRALSWLGRGNGALGDRVTRWFAGYGLESVGGLACRHGSPSNGALLVRRGRAFTGSDGRFSILIGRKPAYVCEGKRVLQEVS